MQITAYNQRDDRWHTEKIGTGSVDLGNAGCLVSVMASLCTYYGHPETPSTLNKKLSKIINGQPVGYASQNMYKWYEGVPKLYPDIKCVGLYSVPDPLTAGQEAIIDDELKNNRPVVCEVDFNPYTAVVDMHWVLIYDKKDGVYQVMDPWDGKFKAITTYGTQKITIQYFVLHTGTIGTQIDYHGLDPNNPSSVQVVYDTFHDVQTGKYVKKTDFDQLNSECDAFEKMLSDVEATNDTLENENNSLIKSSREKDATILKLTPSATKWDVVSKMFKADSPEGIDEMVRQLNQCIVDLQNSTTSNQVLEKYKQQVIDLKKLSVKTVSKTTLIKELLSRTNVVKLIKLLKGKIWLLKNH
jgi:hypothetical protein